MTSETAAKHPPLRDTQVHPAQALLEQTGEQQRCGRRRRDRLSAVAERRARLPSREALVGRPHLPRACFSFPSLSVHPRYQSLTVYLKPLEPFSWKVFQPRDRKMISSAAVHNLTYGRQNNLFLLCKPHTH